jgi:formylglycine-generating enzyme required for sulfatase activity
MPTPPPSDPRAKKDAPPSRFETPPASALPATGVWSGASGDGALSLQPGVRPLPEYELVRKLGAGGFGEVWHARGPGGMDVALKFIKLSGAGSALELRALEMMKSVRHANLVSLFGVWRKDDLLILAMELCDRTLHDRLREARAQNLPGIPLAELLNYMRDAANGLDALNAKQVQHRDVKPSNLFLLAGSAKVGDFGLAKLLEQTVGSHTGAMTPAYAAPEFMKGQVSQHSDQYSLAVAYCELRTGRRPFGGNIHQMMLGHLEQPPDLSRLDAEERAVVARALAKEPGQRWPSCRAFVDALILAAQGGKSKAKSPAQREAGITTTIAPSTTGRWLRAGLAGALCVGILSLFAVGGALFSGLFSDAKPTNPTRDMTRNTERTSRDDEQPSKQADKDNATTNDGKDKDKQPDPKPPTLPATMTIDLGDGVEMELVLLNAKGNAAFLMGSPPDEKERNPWEKNFDAEKQHKVTLAKPFYLAKYPVTQEQYEKLTGKYPSYFSISGGGKEVQGMDTSRFPVDTVSWDDAKAFCEKLMDKHGEQMPAVLRQQKYRFALPTEAQWEYACRAGTTTPFYFGSELNGKSANCNGNYPYGTTDKGPYKGRTTKVGEYGENKFGLCDMHGNVCQWCEDYYGPYDLPAKDPLRSVKYSEERRVMRGGSWLNHAWFCPAACRHYGAPGGRRDDVGFRVAFRLD